jgi:ketosteroid isomerase-like protein
MSTSTPSPNVQAIQSLYTAFTTGDITAFTANLSPHIIWTEATGFAVPGTFHSAEEIVTNMLGGLQHDWSDFAWETEYIIDGNEYVVGVGMYKGTNKATGKSFEMRGNHVWKLEGGKIVKFDGFGDTWIMRGAMK